MGIPAALGFPHHEAGKKREDSLSSRYYQKILPIAR